MLPIRRYWKLLRTYLEPQWRRVALLALLLSGKIAARLINPQIIRAFLDNALAGAPLESLLRDGALFMLIAAATQCLTVANLYVSESVAWTATNGLRRDVFRHLLGLDLAFHKGHTPGELAERIDSDVDALSNFFARFALNVIGNGVLAVGILLLLFREGWQLGVGGALFAVGGLVVLVRLRKLTVPYWERLHDVRARFYGMVGEQLAGTEDIQANGAQGYVMQRLYQALRGWLPVRRQTELAAYSGWMTNAALVAVGECLSYGLAGYLVFRGRLTLGAAYLVANYFGLLFGQIAELRWQISDLQHADAGMGRVEALLSRRPTVRDSHERRLPEGALPVALDAVSFAYADGAEVEDGQAAAAEPVLRDISFRLEPGSTMGLLGRTGSGKTTLARLLLRLYDPSEGCVRLGEVPLTATSRRDVRSRVALVTQEVQLFRGSVRDNLTLFDQSIPDEQLLGIVVEVGLGAWLATLPEGLATRLDAGGTGLSAGQAQLLALARVFLTDPGLVILDEASSRLDPATERLLEQAVGRLLEGRTAIIIAHRLRTVQRADRLLILEEGRIVEQGERLSLASNPTSHFHRLLQTGLEQVLA